MHAVAPFVLVLMSEREALDVDVPPAHARSPEVGLEDIGHGGRSADVDISLAEVWDELAQVLGREQPPTGFRGMVSDDVFDPDAGALAEPAELAAKTISLSPITR